MARNEPTTPDVNEDADLAAATAMSAANQKAFEAAQKEAAEEEVVYLSPDGVERTAYTAAEKIALNFAGWTVKDASKKSSTAKKDA